MKVKEGVKGGGGGVNINNIRYAELVADTEEKLQELVIALHRACVARGLKLMRGQAKRR